MMMKMMIGNLAVRWRCSSTSCKHRSDSRRLHKSLGLVPQLCNPTIGWCWSPRSQYFAWPWFVGFTAESLKHIWSWICVREADPDHLILWHCTRAVQSVDPINTSMWAEKACGVVAVISIPAREIWKLWLKPDCILLATVGTYKL